MHSTREAHDFMTDYAASFPGSVIHHLSKQFETFFVCIRVPQAPLPTSNAVSRIREGTDQSDDCTVISSTEYKSCDVHHTVKKSNYAMQLISDSFSPR